MLSPMVVAVIFFLVALVAQGGGWSLTREVARLCARNCRCLSKLPFGEELQAGVGGRTAGQGYQPDNIRQQFTGYERDGETGLDYAQARYYASVQGRFISPDPLLSSGQPTEPQSWNRYAYVLNNPLVYVDPSGLIWGYQDGYDGNGNRKRFFQWFDGDQVGEGYTAYNSSYHVGADEVLWLDSRSNAHLRIARSNFSEEEYASLLSAQGTDSTSFSDAQRSWVSREIADQFAGSGQFAFQKGVAGGVGSLAGGIGGALRFSFSGAGSGVASGAGGASAPMTFVRPIGRGERIADLLDEASSLSLDDW